jgi:hypothetical protein
VGGGAGLGGGRFDAGGGGAAFTRVNFQYILEKFEFKLPLATRPRLCRQDKIDEFLGFIPSRYDDLHPDS